MLDFTFFEEENIYKNFIVNNQQEFLNALINFDGEAKFWIENGSVFIVCSTENLDNHKNWDYVFSDELDDFDFKRLFPC